MINLRKAQNYLFITLVNKAHVSHIGLLLTVNSWERRRCWQ